MKTFARKSVALIAFERETSRSETPIYYAFRLSYPNSNDFREVAAIFDHTVRSALSHPRTSRAPGFTTPDHAYVRDSNAAQGNTQDMEAISANQSRKECHDCIEARRPGRPASRI